MAPSETRRGPGDTSPGPSSFQAWSARERTPADDAVRAFIRANLPLTPVRARPDILLHTAAPASGLRRLLEAGDGDAPPYWAYPWAGGLAIARHLAAHPGLVAGRRVLDLGCGSGLVAIAAARAGAQVVFASDIDAHAAVATELNAAANGVAVTVVGGDLVAGPPPPVEVIVVGDLFYAPDLAARIDAFLHRCVERETAVLVGDPGRAWLPHGRLRRLADYPTLDFGDVREGEGGTSAVYAYGNGAED